MQGCIRFHVLGSLGVIFCFSLSSLIFMHPYPLAIIVVIHHQPHPRYLACNKLSWQFWCAPQSQLVHSPPANYLQWPSNHHLYMQSLLSFFFLPHGLPKSARFWELQTAFYERKIQEHTKNVCFQQNCWIISINYLSGACQ